MSLELDDRYRFIYLHLYLFYQITFTPSISHLKPHHIFKWETDPYIPSRNCYPKRKRNGIQVLNQVISLMLRQGHFKGLDYEWKKEMNLNLKAIPRVTPPQDHLQLLDLHLKFLLLDQKLNKHLQNILDHYPNLLIHLPLVMYQRLKP